MEKIFLKKIQILFIFIFILSNAFSAQVSINPAKEPKIIIFETESKTLPKDMQKQSILEQGTAPLKLQKQETPKELKSEQKLDVKKETQLEISKPIIKQNISTTKEEKIGFVFASNNIGKYAIEASNVAATYLVHKNTKFNVEFFDIETENQQNITAILDTLKEKNIKKVVVLFTGNSLWALSSYPDIGAFDLYLPLVNKSAMKNAKSNFVFGGIDYKKQFAFLTSKVSSNVIEIYDDSAISKRLHDEFMTLNVPNLINIQITGKVPNYKILLENSEQIKNSTIILNTSIVKSAIVLSHLKENNIAPKEILSTQLNYSPVIFNLTTQEERANLFMTNSIDILPRDLEELISLFGNDALFSWVNYSVVLGLEYFITNQTKLFGNIQIKSNQVDYPIKKIGFNGNRFVDL